MYNPVVNKAFQFTAADHARYGTTAFGNACLVAKQVLEANQGTRFIQITQGGWDMHQNIYAASQLPAMGKLLDDGVADADRRSEGERAAERDPDRDGGRIRPHGGSADGGGGPRSLPAAVRRLRRRRREGRPGDRRDQRDGSDTVDYGWSQQRYVYPEDIEATIYSAMGINWTTVRQDDPFHRGFAYVPDTDPVKYAPINELWA